jgi:hypothetical protein
MDSAVNLLPPDLQKRAIRFQVVTRWCPVLLVCAIAVSVRGHQRWAECDQLSEHVRADAAEMQEATALLQNVQRTDTRVNVLKTQLDRLQQLQPSPDPMALMLAISRATELTQSRLILSSLHVANNTTVIEPLPMAAESNRPATSDSPESEELVTRLDLTGRALNDLAVARFVTGLRDNSLFDSVRLVSSLPTRSDSPLQREFIVECVRTEQLR